MSTTVQLMNFLVIQELVHNTLECEATELRCVHILIARWLWGGQPAETHCNNIEITTSAILSNILLENNTNMLRIVTAVE